MDAPLLLLLKASLLLSLPLAAARLLRRAPAAMRHGFCTLTFAAVLALPFLASALPALYIPVPERWRVSPAPRALTPAPRALVAAPRGLARAGEHDERVQPTLAEPAPVGQSIAGDERGAAVSPSQPAAGADPPPRVESDAISVALPAAISARVALLIRAGAWVTAARGAASRLLPIVWLTGTIAATAVLLVSLLRVRRLARVSEEVNDPEWRRAADTLGARLGLRRPARLLASDGVSTPMAAGVFRPIIFLPSTARTWSPECREVVLSHELAHLAARDPLRHLAARLAVACYWFNPLAWLAARQATAAREQACDEAVLALGTRPSSYARVLLDLADAMSPAAPAPLGALPMVERSLLETRLMAILNPAVRPATRRRILIPAIGVASLTLSLAAAQPMTATATPDGERAASSTTQTPTVTGSALTPSTEPAAASTGSPLSTLTSPSSTPSSWSTPGTPTPASTLAFPAGTLTLAQDDVDRDTACWWNLGDGRSFSGSMWSSTDASGRSVIREQVGSRGTDRIVQKRFGDLRVCMLAEDVGDRDRREGPSQWLGRAARVVLEARHANAVQRLEIGRQSGGGQRVSWQVNRAERPFDAVAQQWRDRMLAALDPIWELAVLRGEVSSLRGQISSIRGEESSLRGEISSLRGEVSSMRGRISSVRGEESSLRGRISSIEGEVSSMRGQISSARGAISSLNATPYTRDPAEHARIGARIDQHQAEIARIERAIRDYNADAKIAAVEREIAALDANGKVAAIEAEIRTFDLAGKTAAIERRISELDVPGKVAALERQIAALDADRRGRALEERRDAELKRLEAAVASVR